MGEWTEEDEKKHPRGTGAQGGQFVTKEESNAQQWSQQRAEERKAEEQRSKVVTEFAPWKPQEKTSTKKTRSSGGRSSGGHSRGRGKGSSGSKSSLGKNGLEMGGDNDPAEVKELQSLLHDLGLFGGKPNGNFDRFTERAVMEAQRKLGVKKPNGRASTALIRKMQAARALSPCLGRTKEAFEGGDVSAAALVSYARRPALTLVRLAREAFDESKHLRGAKGRFKDMFSVLDDWAHGKGDENPLDGFDRPALISGAKKLGLKPNGRRWPDDHQLRKDIYAAKRAEFNGEAPRSMSDAAIDRPESMSDIAAELDGLSDREKRTKMKGWGFSDRETNELLGANSGDDKPKFTPKDVSDPSRAALTADDRAHHILIDDELTTRQKRSRMKSMGLAQEDIDRLAPSSGKATDRVAAAKAERKASMKAEADKLRQARVDDAVKRYNKGQSLEEIAQEQGVAASTIHKMLTGEGIQLRRRGGQRQPGAAKRDAEKAKASLVADAKKRYERGESLSEIAAATGKSDATIHRLLTGEGVQLRPRGGRATKAATPRVQKEPRRSSAEIAQGLKTVESREEAHALLAGQSLDELKQLAEDMDLTIPAAQRTSKTKMASAIVERTTGNRLDSKAIRGDSRLPYQGEGPDRPEFVAPTPSAAQKAEHDAYLADAIAQSAAKPKGKSSPPRVGQKARADVIREFLRDHENDPAMDEATGLTGASRRPRDQVENLLRQVEQGTAGDDELDLSLGIYSTDAHSKKRGPLDDLRERLAAVQREHGDYKLSKATVQKRRRELAARPSSPAEVDSPASKLKDPMAREVAGYLETLGVNGEDRLGADAEARRYLANDVKLNREGWRKLAANLGVETQSGDSISAMRDAIQRQLVTRRLEHGAYMGAAAPASGNPAKRADTALDDAVTRLMSQSDSGWVSIADLRESPEFKDLPRAEQDAAIKRLAGDASRGDVINVENAKSLTPRDRAAAISIGGREQHAIRLKGKAGGEKAGDAGPKAPRKSGLPMDRRPQTADFEDLAGRIEGKTPEAILDLIEDLSAWELARLAKRFPGGIGPHGRDQGLNLPEAMTLEERRRWLAKQVGVPKGQRHVPWR